MSSGHAVNASVGDVLLKNIPGAVNVCVSTEAEDRKGTDWWVHLENGKRLSVDCKVRASDWAATHPEEDDIALESWSVMQKDIVGWTRDSNKETDYILWLWRDSGRWLLIPFPMLCAVFQEKWGEWKKRYRTAVQYTPRQNGNGYNSECIFVDRREVWAEIYKKFGGAP